MKKLGLNTLREMFIDYFKENNHYTVKSYPLVPQNDKSLLYIVAGMVPLKDYFAGISTPPSLTMATSQKCVRTNDIDNVGYTARHCSMFEMLGNFSFGDYFKDRAIELAWNFFIQKLEIPAEKLSVSVYEEDDESYDIWTKKMNLPAEKVVRLGKEDNFWEIGSGTGPCGPCTEIFFDRGVERGCGSADCKAGCECDRFVEVWNLVFTQFDKQKDGSLKPLEKKNIDTGMGLERLACVMQDVDSVFDVDVFQKLIENIEKISGKKYGANKDDDVSIRIISDHIRAVTFIISEGVTPDNEGRGYVLRMLFRRAVRRGKLLGINEKFMSKLANVIIDIYKSSYEELDERREYILNIVDLEEDRFAKTLEQGLKILDGYMDDMKKNGETKLSGERAFKLYDTYGFPLDLTKDVVRAVDFTVDQQEFEKHMNNQRELARSSRSKDSAAWSGDALEAIKGIKTEFVGYEHIEYVGELLCILSDKSSVQTFTEKGKEFLMVFDKSPMFCECGGQVSDNGLILADGVKVKVLDIVKLNQDVVAHKVVLEEGQVKVGDKLNIVVNNKKRMDTRRNHTATHLVHQALRDELGPSTEQAGSLVDEFKLRFDFTANQPVPLERLKKVERVVNEYITRCIPVETIVTDVESAKKTGAIALFGEKYEDIVRVVKVSDYSIELCGGTHVSNTSEIASFRIISESAAASGVRRIEAVTGMAAYNLNVNDELKIDSLSKTLKTQKPQIENKVVQLLNENKELNAELDKVRSENLSKVLDDILASAVEVDGFKIVTAVYENQDNKVVRGIADDICNRDGAYVAVILNEMKGKLSFVVKANKDAVKLGANSGQIVKNLAVHAGGNGGGKPEMAQAGAKDKSKALDAIKNVEKFVK